MRRRLIALRVSGFGLGVWVRSGVCPDQILNPSTLASVAKTTSGVEGGSYQQMGYKGLGGLGFNGLGARVWQ